MIETVVLIVHVLACIGLVLVVLLQTGKGASLGAAFGGSSSTVFGSAGATTFLAKMTTGVAVLFMLTSLGLAVYSARSTGGGLMEKTQPAIPAPATAPAVPTGDQGAANMPAPTAPAPVASDTAQSTPAAPAAPADQPAAPAAEQPAGSGAQPADSGQQAPAGGAQ